MRYNLWSHGRLLGHTDLDIDTVTPTMRQGFIEPTEQGVTALRDATGVMRVMAEDRRHQLETGARQDEYLDLFQEACSRRDSLDLELRDEQNVVFGCEFMRVYDIREMESDWGSGSPSDELDDRLLQEHLASLSPEDRAEFEAQIAADAEMIEEWIEEIEQERADEEMFHSSWPPPKEYDERWETMQYHLQVFLKRCVEDTADEL